MAIIRVFFMKMEESPKWLVSQGRFAEAIAALQAISEKNKRPLTTSESDFMIYQPTTTLDVTDKALSHMVHVKGLFATSKLSRSTGGLILLWMSIGIA